jgi:hypothetical protein
MTGLSDGAGSEPRGPICPNCGALLRETLRSEQIAPVETSDATAPVSVIFCGSCGWTLAATPARARLSFGPGGSPEVAAPADESTLAGQFQLRCRELIGEIIAVGFVPVGWINLINSTSAVEVAKDLLSGGRILPVTFWLVQQGRPDLTLEREVTQERWADLFTDDDRVEAERRLASPRRRDPG